MISAGYGYRDGSVVQNMRSCRARLLDSVLADASRGDVGGAFGVGIGLENTARDGDVASWEENCGAESADWRLVCEGIDELTWGS
jgi:hypothetical protein